MLLIQTITELDPVAFEFFFEPTHPNTHSVSPQRLRKMFLIRNNRDNKGTLRWKGRPLRGFFRAPQQAQ